MKKISLIIMIGLLLILDTTLISATLFDDIRNLFNKTENITTIEEQSIKPHITKTTYISKVKNYNSHHMSQIYFNNGRFQMGDLTTYLIVNGDTHSMIPTFDIGNIVLVQDYKEFKKNQVLEIGDIIAFKCKGIYNGKQTIHRIIDMNKKYLITKGDNNNYSEKINYDCITYVIKGAIFK